MAVHASGIWKFIVLVKLRNLSDATRCIRVAAQTFCAPCQVVWDLRRARSGQGWLCRRDRRLVAREASIVRQANVVGGIRSYDALGPMTELTIGRAANRVRDFFWRHTGLRPRRHGRREDLGERGRVESCERPLGSMTRAIRTERRIVFAAGVPRVMALLTRPIESRTMLGEPSGCAVRFRLIGAGCRECGCRAVRERSRRDAGD